MRRLAIVMLMAISLLTIAAQRRINPVKPAASAGAPAKEEPDTSRRRYLNVAHIHDDNGNVILVDTITGMQLVDSTPMLKAPPKMEYPLWHYVSLGVDLWDPLMRAFGEHYGIVGFSASVSMHNRYKPTIEAGLGNASFTPEEGNFTYKSPVAPFFKIGCDYNFFYNSNPAYELLAGVRFGFTPFRYELTDVKLGSSYWDETTIFNVPEQKVFVSYFEALVGVKVKIWRNISMGWNARYRVVMSQSKAQYGDPWYIPGYGTKNMHWGGSFSIYYTLPLNSKSAKEVINESGKPSKGSKGDKRKALLNSAASPSAASPDPSPESEDGVESAATLKPQE